ncbi:hypothetical protein DB88DRAFT_501410 [Papiliotrema laurentii]|uniref:RING-type domain-containing protein n=1 Tax=Papiliotrema laurentii TaxID=5418 RepID=A0AAD9FLM2_PAPLA|nr:hypothetical protein DB88DRAFT_501410 [Papiliotrema laurentii]
MPVIRRRQSTTPSSLSYAPTEASDSPRPTLADIPLSGRKRLRDGSRARGGSRGSRASSVASSSRSGPSSHNDRIGSSTRLEPVERPGRSSPRRETNPADGRSEDRVAEPSAASYSVEHGRGTTIRLLRRDRERAGSKRAGRDADGRADVRSSPDSTSLSEPGAETTRRTDHHSSHQSDPGSSQSLGTHSTRPSPSPSSAPSSTYSPGGTRKRRRFTAQEKGKGKAVVPDPIEVEDGEEDEEESFEVIDVKRRKLNGEKPEPESSPEPVSEAIKADAEVEPEAEIVDEDKRLSAYTCPVCFCAPEQPVMTLCGHVMCDKCLFESLVAAVKRQHDPMPQAPPAHRGRGRGRGRVASSYLPARSVTHPSVHPLGGPAGWTAETLKTAWTQQMERVYYRQLQKHGMAEENWEAAKGCDPMAPHESNVTVQEILKGVWTINGEFFVIEGECPVCRKPLPGGYGPEGIGGLVPLRPHLAGR